MIIRRKKSPFAKHLLINTRFQDPGQMYFLCKTFFLIKILLSIKIIHSVDIINSYVLPILLCWRYLQVLFLGNLKGRKDRYTAFTGFFLSLKKKEIVNTDLNGRVCLLSWWWWGVRRKDCKEFFKEEKVSATSSEKRKGVTW